MAMGDRDQMRSRPNLVRLMRAMAPWQDVLNCVDDWSSEEGQEQFATQVQTLWDNEQYGPSKRYLRNIVSKYVTRLEGKYQAQVESDSLALLVLTSSTRGVPPPDADESCQLSFDLDPFVLSSSRGAQGKNENDVDNSSASADDIRRLRIRVFPYHNDVALRLWEAGARLAEFFVANPDHVKGRKVVELGAGVGCTGLVLAGCCGAESVFLTDYTEACLNNLEYNIQLNLPWVNRMRSMKNENNKVEVFQGSLEWGTFSKNDIPVAVSDAEDETVRHFLDADLLIAADVIYDISVVENMVMVIGHFLRAPKSNPNQQRQAILAMTKRNQSSFELFLRQLEKHGVACDWIADGEDCETLPLIFPSKFIQPRSDVSIGLLACI